MIRPLDWRDLSLMHRLRSGGLCLDSQLAFTRGPHTVQHALLDMLNPIQSTHTLVARTQGQGGPDCLGQFMYRQQDGLARLAFFSPASMLGAASGQHLLDALTHTAGGQGARHLVAEVDEHIPAFEALRRAGFAVYARQRIWRLEAHRTVTATDSSLAPASPRHLAWRHETSADELAVTTLYSNLVPGLVQQVEAPPHRNGRGWVHAHQTEILGYLSIDRGPIGFWVQPYLHPAADAVDELLLSFFGGIDLRPDRPLYIVVRSYQSWLNDILERLGLQPACDQAVMVRRLVVPIRQTASVSERAPSGATAETTAPMAQFNPEPGSPGRSRRISGRGNLHSGGRTGEEKAFGQSNGR
jgi:hypothetical protein